MLNRRKIIAAIAGVIFVIPASAWAEDHQQNNQRKNKTEAFIDGVFEAADRAGKSSERGNDKAYNLASKLSRFIIRERTK